MSWGGGGGFFGPSAGVRSRAASAIMADPRQEAASAISPPLKLDDLRAVARDAYATGRLADAAAAQSGVLAMTRTVGAQTADDFLFAGLIHHADRRVADGIEVLRDGLRLYPDNASLHENLAVLLLAAFDIAGSIAACEAALALGSDSASP
jgi:tetratricopeptide (TPR) repeat protein